MQFYEGNMKWCDSCVRVIVEVLSVKGYDDNVGCCEDVIVCRVGVASVNKYGV